MPFRLPLRFTPVPLRVALLLTLLLGLLERTRTLRRLTRFRLLLTILQSLRVILL